VIQPGPNHFHSLIKELGLIIVTCQYALPIGKIVAHLEEPKAESKQRPRSNRKSYYMIYRYKTRGDLLESVGLPKLIETLSIWENKKAITGLTCFLAVLFGGITVWSINGTYSGDLHLVNDYWIDQWTVNPIVQGIFASITITLLFISIYLLISIQLDALIKKMR
jgi:hypothetical protein